MVFFCLMAILSYSYFLERTAILLPSSIATLLITIGFLIIVTDAPNIMLHPLQAFYYNSSVITNYTYQQFYNFGKNSSIDFVILSRANFNMGFLSDFDSYANFTLLYAPYPYTDFVYGAYKFVE